METTVKEFIDMSLMAEELIEILTDTRDGYLDEDRDFILSEYPDELIEDRAWGMAYEFNEDMGKYLNAKDHKIFGNFNNVDYDYPYHITEDVHYDIPLVQSMISRLNAGEKSEQADSDRKWLVEWFFDTFGTFGISYNFSEEISETLYENNHKNDGC